MLPRTGDFDRTVAAPHTAIAALEVLDGDQPAGDVDTADFTVNADSKAAQLRSLTALLPGTEGNVPASLADRLGPGGTRVRASRGVRIPDIVTVGGPIVSAAGWAPTTDYGVLNGVVAESDGALTLGWT